MVKELDQLFSIGISLDGSIGAKLLLQLVNREGCHAVQNEGRWDAILEATVLGGS